MIHLVQVTNPFLPASSRIQHEIGWRKGISLAEVLEAAGINPAKYLCVVDGLVVPQEMLTAFTAEENSIVVAMPNVAGGFGKMFAEIGVMVAAAVAVAALGPAGIAALGIAGGTMTATGASLVGAAISLGGNLLINMFMSGAKGSGVDSNSFDPTGPKTVASGGTPIPKGYGTFRSAGNIIASYVSAEGPDNYLNVLVSHGWGTVAGFKNIRINNNDIGNYKAATYQVRLGYNNQSPIPYFNNIVNGYPQAVRVAAPGPHTAGTPSVDGVVIEGTGTRTQGLEVVMQLPQGLYWTNDDGSLRSLSTSWLVEYSVSGSGVWNTPIIPDPNGTIDLVTYNFDGTVASAPTWVVVPTDQGFSSGLVYDHDNGSHTPGDAWSGTKTVTYYNPNGSGYTGTIALQGEWQPFDINLNQKLVAAFNGGWVVMTDANTGTLYHTTPIFNLPPNKYDVRVTKYGSAFAGDPIQPGEPDNSRTGDQTWIHSINEIQYQDLAYPGIALLGVRALATDQLSGSAINITADVTFEINAALPAELAGFGHDNPAIVAYDMLVDTLYGGGIDPSYIDIPAWVAWANFNDEMVSDGFGGTQKRHVFNGIFDQQGTNLWKSIQRVGLMSSAAVLRIGRNYTVILDAPVDVPAQIFTSANIIRDSLKDTWMSLDDRANRIEVTFADIARDYRTDEPCSVMLPSDIQAGVDVKPTRVQLLGCTNRAQAWHWAYRKLMSTSKLLLTRSFDVGIEAIACQVGSVIGVQDDVANWAQGGRIKAGSTTTSLVIDRDDLTFAAGEGWTVSVMHPLVERGTGTIQSITGKVVTFTAALPAGRILSIENAEGALGIVQGTGAGSVTLESATAFSVGQVVTFYDQDVIETQPVASVEGYTLIPLNSFLQPPTEDCSWVYGQTAGAFPAKLFTVVNITRKSDFRMTIDTIEYNPAVYADDTPIITQTLGTPDVNAAVTTLTLKENYVQATGANGGQASIISCGWQNGPNTAATQIWVARNDANQPISAENLVLTVAKGTTCSLSYPTGTILQVRAVGVDGKGNPAPFATAPVQTITVQGAGLAPGNVTGFNGNYQSSGTTFTWTAPANAATYEIRYNSDPANSNWQSGQLLWAGTGTTWEDATIRGGLYLIKALTADSVESVSAATFSLQQSSSYLNALGLAPSQLIVVNVTQNSYIGSHATVTLGWDTQTLYRIDGSTVSLAAGTLSWSGLLAPTTTYYFYLRLRLSDMTMHVVSGDPPTLPYTAVNPPASVQQSADGYYAGPTLSVTTPTTSGTGGGSTGGGVCPDGRELVETKERGRVEVRTVCEGEHILGRDKEGSDCWKRILYVRSAPASAWYLVKGYRMSPMHPVFVDGAWRSPCDVGTFDPGVGLRVHVTVDESDYDSQNFLLVGRDEPLMIHNWSLPPGSDPGC